MDSGQRGCPKNVLSPTRVSGMAPRAPKPSPRRTPGTGTMRERPLGSGRWQLRAFAGFDELTGTPRQVTKTFVGTEAKAKVALGKFVADVNDGKFEPTTATVGELLDKWLEAATVSQRPRTLEENRRKIETPDPPGARERPAEQAVPGAPRHRLPPMARRGPVAGDRAQVPLHPQRGLSPGGQVGVAGLGTDGAGHAAAGGAQGDGRPDAGATERL